MSTTNEITLLFCSKSKESNIIEPDRNVETSNSIHTQEINDPNTLSLTLPNQKTTLFTLPHKNAYNLKLRLRNHLPHLLRPLKQPQETEST